MSVNSSTMLPTQYIGLLSFYGYFLVIAIRRGNKKN